MTHTEEEHFIGYAALEPFVLNNENTHLKIHEFKPKPLEADEVEILVRACGM